MEEAARILEGQIAEGRALAEALRSEEGNLVGTTPWLYNFRKWLNVTKTALNHVYVGYAETEKFADDTNLGSASRQWQWGTYRGALSRGLHHLESLNETIPFAAVLAASTAEAEAPSREPSGERGEIFLVHGHDRRREEVKNFLENTCQSRYKVVILDEQPALGRTLIERLEQHGQRAAYAVILFTADDVGAAKADGGEAQKVNPRARQNVVFEFGWFCGQIGRERVAVLYEPGVELPSDIGGLTFIDLGNDDRAVRLARDLKAAGLVDSRRANPD
jgi:predicted nucleotide-binding protein